MTLKTAAITTLITTLFLAGCDPQYQSPFRKYEQKRTDSIHLHNCVEDVRVAEGSYWICKNENVTSTVLLIVGPYDHTR